MLHGLVIALQLTTPPVPPPHTDCGAEETSALALAERHMAKGDEVSLRRAVEDTIGRTAQRCDAVQLVRFSVLGWTEARALAPLGGPVWLLGSSRMAIDQLQSLRAGRLALDAEYAQTSIQAAVAAAQDERAELALLLTHARDLSERLSDRGRRATWPRPFNLLAGELWLEVDRYDEARLAFERAVRVEASPVALAGLGESLERQGRRDEACAAYRRVNGAAGTLAAQTRAFLATCP